MDDPVDTHEWKRRALAVPIAMVVALAFHAWSTGHFMQRTALTMPLHELGHAVTSWMCGITGVPTLWKTLIPEERGVIAPVVVIAIAGFLVVRGWQTERMWQWGLGLGLAAGLFVGVVVASNTTAHIAITFGGDAGAMVLGTGLMLAFLVGRDSRLRAGGLRWGLLAIGAAAFVDTFSMWWSARKDIEVIPFGEIEGVGLSDPSKLQDDHGWTAAQITDRYVALGVACLIVLVVRWAWAVHAARRARA